MFCVRSLHRRYGSHTRATPLAASHALLEEWVISVHPQNSLAETPEEIPRRSGPLRNQPPGRNGLFSIFAKIRAAPPRLVALGVVVALQIVLLLVALVPPTIWADHGLPNGPIPTTAAPIVAGLFYVLPSLTGLLARRWQVAIILATLPAWLDLGIFAVAASVRIGPYYLVLEPHAVSTVGTLELFAALGALGWLARPLVISALTWLRQAARR